mgnify:CR=1 FL=1
MIQKHPLKKFLPRISALVGLALLAAWMRLDACPSSYERSRSLQEFSDTFETYDQTNQNHHSIVSPSREINS